MVSVFDSLDDVNAQIAACKTAILSLMQGKSVRFNAGTGERLWSSEDLDKLQNYLAFLGRERAKFQGRGASVAVVARPGR